MPRVDGHIHLVLNQTDAAATHGQSVACSGAALTADVGNDRLLEVGGTQGTTPYTVTVAGSSTEAAVFWETAALDRTLWNAGYWYVYLTINSAHADITLTEAWICRVNSAGVSQETVASVTGVSFAIPTGKVNLRLLQAADITALATDRAYIVFVLTNANVAAQDVVLVPNRGIVTPMHVTTNIVLSTIGATGYVDGVTVTSPQAITPPSAGAYGLVSNQVSTAGGGHFNYG